MRKSAVCLLIALSLGCCISKAADFESIEGKWSQSTDYNRKDVVISSSESYIFGTNGTFRKVEEIVVHTEINGSKEAYSMIIMTNGKVEINGESFTLVFNPNDIQIIQKGSSVPTKKLDAKGRAILYDCVRSSSETMTMSLATVSGTQLAVREKGKKAATNYLKQ